MAITEFYNLNTPEGTEVQKVLRYISKTTNDAFKTLMVTSTKSSEGKSVVSSLIAMTYCQEYSNNVLLIDLDLRRPSIHTLFDLPLGDGVIDLIQGHLTIGQAIKHSNIDGLDIITSGNISNDANNILANARIMNMLDQLSHRYDKIIIDSPPVLPVIDALTILDYVDYAVLVLKLCDTTHRQAELAMKSLYSHKKKILGVIVNDSNRRLPTEYRYYDNNYYK